MNSNKINNIIFDLGGVLIDWNPKYVYLDIFKGNKKKMFWFFKNICTEKWNLNQDAGYSLDKATNELIKLHPKHKQYIKIYYDRWEEMLGGEIEKTVWILNKLIPQFKVFALTNWFYPHKNWPIKTESTYSFEIIYKGSEFLVDEFPNSKDYYDQTEEKLEKI